MRLLRNDGMGMQGMIATVDTRLRNQPGRRQIYAIFFLSNLWQPFTFCMHRQHNKTNKCKKKN